MRFTGDQWAISRALAFCAVLMTLSATSSSVRASDTVSLLPGGSHLIDFNEFVGRRLETNGPLNLRFGVVWTASHDGWVGDMDFGLRTNGRWDRGRLGFAGLNASTSEMLFTFEEPVNKVGAFVNYAPLNGQGPLPTIEALDDEGRVIDTVTLDIQTPNGVNEGGFLSFEHGTDDIFAFRYRARYGVLDDLIFSRFDGGGIIPGPSSLAALGVAFLGCVGRRRRRS